MNELHLCPTDSKFSFILYCSLFKCRLLLDDIAKLHVIDGDSDANLSDHRPVVTHIQFKMSLPVVTKSVFSKQNDFYKLRWDISNLYK